MTPTAPLEESMKNDSTNTVEYEDSANCEDILFLPLLTHQDAKKLEEETRHLINLNTCFPDLIWKLILQKLTIIEDIKNCSNASFYFGNLLQEKMNKNCVLPKVFQILYKQYSNLNNKDESYREPETIQNGHHIRPHPMTGFWKCRRVCKFWNKAIDDLHQKDDNILARFESGTNFSPTSSLKWILTKFEPSVDVSPRHFLDHFEPTHYDQSNKKPIKNPFIGRSVSIYLPWLRIIYGNEPQELLIGHTNGVRETLKKFGSEIWYCSIFSSWSEYENLYHRFNREVIELVKLMPNLKFLQVKTIRGHSQYMDTLEGRLPWLVILEVEKNLRKVDFPLLPRLKMVSTENLSVDLVNLIRIGNPNAIFL